MKGIYMRSYLVSVTLAVVTAVSIASAEDDQGERIREARAEYNDAIARHDVPAIIAFLDDEYQITTSLGQLLNGPDAEAAGWQELFDSRQDVVYVRSPESIEVSQDYPLAAETGTWVGTWSTSDGPVRTGGRYSAMWRQVEGVWKVRSELFVALYCDGINCP